MKILLVEDEPAVALIIKRSLEEEGYEVSIAPDGNTGWDYVQRFTYNLLILDVMMPGISGLEICRRCRQSGNTTPVLMLTALGTTDNIVMGLDNGADDYLTKPFKIAELLARVRSLLRRQTVSSPAPAGPEEAPRNVLSQYGVELDLDQKTVHRDGVQIELTATEFRLLEYLMQNARRVVSRMDILEKVWGYDFDTNTKVVDVYINYLRKKLDTDFGTRLIQTVVGMGYIFKEQ